MFWLNKWEDLKSGKGPNILLFFNKISWQFASPTWMDGGVSERKWKWLLTLWISWVTFHQITGSLFLFNFHMKEEDRRIILLHVLTNWSAMYYISVKLCSPYVCIYVQGDATQKATEIEGIVVEKGDSQKIMSTKKRAW